MTGLCTGSLWGVSLGQSYLNWQQFGGEIQQDVIIEGRVVRYQIYPDLHRVILDSVKQGSMRWPRQAKVMLNYYHPQQQFKRGQIIRGRVRIKPARANANPVGFDAQQWYVSQYIVKTGYVQDTMQLTVPDVSLRGRLQMRLITSSTPGGKWLNALLFGDRQRFTKADWGLLQRTGTAHLFAISGLHLVIVAASSLLLVRVGVILLAVLRLPLPINLRPLSIVVMLSCCGFYGYLAHWQVAVVRAFIMVTIAAMLFMLARRISRLQVLILTAVLNITVMPNAVYGSALFLSLGAVAIILLYYWRWKQLSRQPIWVQCITLQMALTIGMMPLVGGMLGQVSWLSPVFNVILVPMMSLLIVPGCLAGLLLSVIGGLQPLGDLLLLATGHLLDWTMNVLTAIDQYTADWTVLSVDKPDYAVLFFVLTGLAILPSFYGHKRLIIITLLAGSPISSELLWRNDTWQVHFFDVGQGSAALITRNGNAILIDTGSGYGAGNNYFERVIQPFLIARDIELQHVYLSHSDNDHAGGGSALKRLYPRLPIVTPDTGCVRGQQRMWQALQIKVLWPPADMRPLSDNNMSCVLLISDGNYSVLLPGDIEQKAESALLGYVDNPALQATVLLAPHHGSHTSSSAPFIAQIAPQYVVYSQGWLNRWGFPDARVRERYQQHGTKELLISKSGYIRVEFGPTIIIDDFRRGKNAKWFHKTFSN